MLRSAREFPAVAHVPPAPAPLDVSGVKEEVFASQSILLQIFLLGIAFVVGHILRRRKCYYLHEASAALLIGEASIQTLFFYITFKAAKLADINGRSPHNS